MNLKKFSLLGVMLTITALSVVGCCNCNQNVSKDATKVDKPVVAFGTVNIGEVINKSVVVKELRKEADAKMRELSQKMNVELSSKPDSEKVKVYEKFDKEMQDYQQVVNGKMRDHIEGTIAEVAKEKNLQGVFTRDNMPYGGVDITQEVVAKVEKKPETKTDVKTEVKSENKEEKKSADAK